MKTIAAVKGYKLDFTTNTMIVNYTFDAASSEYGSPEYELLKKIRADFPNMKIVVKSGREKKTANKNKRLSYENMEKYISAYENSDELLDVFETVKILSKSEKSPYKYVCKWFAEQFPDYDKSYIFKDGKWQEAEQKKQETKIQKIKFSH